MKLLNYFRWESMIDSKYILGEIPSNKKLYKRIFNIAWPSAMESVALALIGAIDMMMVGNLGANAIAAVGINNQPKLLILAPIMALNIAVTVLISRRRGENNSESASNYLKTAICISLSASIVLSLLAIVFANEILSFAGANSDYIKDAVAYFRIIMIGNMFYSCALTISAAQRGVGQTKVSLKINLSANLVNLVFNAILINGLFGFPRLEVVGAAIATSIGNFVALVIAVSSIYSKTGFFEINHSKKWFDMAGARDLFSIASSSILEQLFLRLGFLMYSKGVAGLGTIEFAAHQVVMNVMVITFSMGDGLSIATSSLVGQSLGAKRSDLAIINGKISQRIGFAVAIAASILTVIFKNPILGFFTNDSLVIETAFIPITILSVCMLFQIPQVITVGSLRGAGDVKFVASLMLVSVAIIRPGLTYILCYPLHLGLPGAWFSVLLDQLTRNVISHLRFKQAKWIKIEV